MRWVPVASAPSRSRRSAAGCAGRRGSAGPRHSAARVLFRRSGASCVVLLHDGRRCRCRAGVGIPRGGDGGAAEDCRPVPWSCGLPCRVGPRDRRPGTGSALEPVDGSGPVIMVGRATAPVRSRGGAWGEPPATGWIGSASGCRTRISGARAAGVPDRRGCGSCRGPAFPRAGACCGDRAAGFRGCGAGRSGSTGRTRAGRSGVVEVSRARTVVSRSRCRACPLRAGDRHLGTGSVLEPGTGSDSVITGRRRVAACRATGSRTARIARAAHPGPGR